METADQQPKNNKIGWRWLPFTSVIVISFYFFIIIKLGFYDHRDYGSIADIVNFLLILLWLICVPFSLILGFRSKHPWYKLTSLLVGAIGVIWIVLIIFLILFPSPEPRKSSDRSIMSTISSMRVQAEINLLGNGPDDWHYPSDICEQNSGPLNVLFRAIVNSGAKEIKCFSGSDLKSWAVSVELPKSKNFYCVDSTGSPASKVSQSITGPSCGRPI